MNKKAFSKVVSLCLAMATTSGLALATTAQAETPLHRLTDAQGKLTAQAPANNESSAMMLPEGTLVFSQTSSVAMRVYSINGILRFNLYNKRTGVTEILGASVTAASTETGMIYRYAGQRTVEIEVAKSGEQTITIDGETQQNSGAITGIISYLPRIALPPNAVVDVSLVDVSRADSPAVALSSIQMVSGGRQVPFPFELIYDPGQVNSGSFYAVQAHIMVDGEQQFVSTNRVPVITNGNPTEVNVQVDLIDQAAADVEQLQNTVWQLDQIQYNDGKLLTPDAPANYTVQFMSDGQLSIGADCNRALGSFTANDNSLSIELGPTTLAACSPESIDQDYLQALQSAGLYFFRDSKLFIDLKFDSGTAQFSSLNGR